jgi:preprotein translocase SecE subunit
MATTTPVRAGGADPTRTGVSWGGFVEYLQGVREELKSPRTTWPTRSELFQLTKVVLLIIFLVAIYCGALDGLLSLVTDRLFTH